MIDSEFIIQYTNALYSTATEYAPRYDEFRDMFSAGQIQSKEWLINELKKFILNFNSIAIAGAWFGTLGLMINTKFPDISINMIDIDPRCEKFVQNIIYNKPTIKYITQDMDRYQYTEDIIINTSCEHIVDLKEWISIIPKDKIVILQSNNYKLGNGHINCVDNEDELCYKSNLSSILYKGTLEMPMYSRFMIIGKS